MAWKTNGSDEQYWQVIFCLLDPKDSLFNQIYISTAQYSFPYVLKRIPVKDRQICDLSPIEVAIDEMNTKVSELTDVVFTSSIDVKKLQLRLQGGVAVQVNAGPLAYANSFLDPKFAEKYDSEKIEDLKEVFR